LLVGLYSLKREERRENGKKKSLSGNQANRKWLSGEQGAEERRGKNPANRHSTSLSPGVAGLTDIEAA